MREWDRTLNGLATLTEKDIPFGDLRFDELQSLLSALERSKTSPQERAQAVAALVTFAETKASPVFGRVHREQRLALRCAAAGSCGGRLTRTPL